MIDNKSTNQSRSAAALLTLAVLLWSGNFITGRAIGAEISALGLNYWRWLLALGILLPVCYPALRRELPLVTRHWKYLAVLGATGIAAFHVFVYQAVSHTTASSALLMLSTAPAFIMILARVAFGDRIRPRQAAGLALSLCGAVYLICRGDLAAVLTMRFGAGELWMMAAVPTWAVYSVLLKRKPAGLSQKTVLTVSTALGLVCMTPLVALQPAHLWISLSVPALGAIAYVGIGASVIAFLCWNRGVELTGPARAGVFIHLMPIFGTLLAVTLLGESLHGYHVAGAALIVTGIVLTQAPMRSRPARSVSGAIPSGA